MCVRVHRAPFVTEPYDPKQRTIRIPTAIPSRNQVIAVRAVLTELGVSQPRYGAVCWCGAPVNLRELIPAQRSPSE